MEKLVNEILDDYIGIAAELSGYVEILNALQLEICQFDGSEPPKERISAQDSLYALWQSMERFKKAWDEQISGYAKRRHQPCSPTHRAENIKDSAFIQGSGTIALINGSGNIAQDVRDSILIQGSGNTLILCSCKALSFFQNNGISGLMGNSHAPVTIKNSPSGKEVKRT